MLPLTNPQWSVPVYNGPWSVLITSDRLQPVVKEEDRLAYVVHQLFHETAIVPRKALLYTPGGAVIRNPSFRGTVPPPAAALTALLYVKVGLIDVGLL